MLNVTAVCKRGENKIPLARKKNLVPIASDCIIYYCLLVSMCMRVICCAGKQNQLLAGFFHTPRRRRHRVVILCGNVNDFGNVWNASLRVGNPWPSRSRFKTARAATVSREDVGTVVVKSFIIDQLSPIVLLIAFVALPVTLSIATSDSRRFRRFNPAIFTTESRSPLQDVPRRLLSIVDIKFLYPCEVKTNTKLYGNRNGGFFS